MNKLKIASTGYPGTTESWKFIKDSYEMIADVLGNMIGSNSAVILAGMFVSGGDITDGYLSYQGEIYTFKGGSFNSNIVLFEEITNVDYNTDPSNSGQLQSLPTYFRRFAQCGNQGEGIADIPFNDLIRLSEIVSIDDRTKQASENTVGIAEIATQAEANAGTDDSRIITPKKLAARTATETRKGIAEIATQAEANANTDDTRIITPKKLAARTATETRKGLAEIATQSEVNAGTDDAKIVTPAKLQEKLNSTFGVVAEFVIDNLTFPSTGTNHFNISALNINNYVIMASTVIEGLNDTDSFFLSWFVKNKTNTGFDYAYEVGIDGGTYSGKIEILVIKVS